jgi:integrase
MRTTSAKAKSSPGLTSVIAATKKLWRPYHLTYDQTHYVAKEVRRALAIERPKTRKKVVARLSREEERKLIAHAYRVQGARGLLIKTLFQTGARVSEFVNIKGNEVFFEGSEYEWNRKLGYASCDPRLRSLLVGVAQDPPRRHAPLLGLLRSHHSRKQRAVT